MTLFGPIGADVRHSPHRYGTLFEVIWRRGLDVKASSKNRVTSSLPRQLSSLRFASEFRWSGQFDRGRVEPRQWHVQGPRFCMHKPRIGFSEFARQTAQSRRNCPAKHSASSTKLAMVSEVCPMRHASLIRKSNTGSQWTEFKSVDKSSRRGNLKKVDESTS